MLNANNSSMNGDLIHAKMETTFKKIKNNTRIFRPQIGRKIRIFSSYKKKECKLGLCSSHFVPDSQRTPDMKM